MARTTYPASFPASEFEVIETALMETARGRWFLAEYARQNRTADTELLLDAIARLESSLTEPSGSPELERIRMDLMEMSETIARAHQEIASVHADKSSAVPVLAAIDVLDAIVAANEQVTAGTLSAAEQVKDAAWRLGQTDAGAAICDELDQLATRIHDVSSLQDINRQRTHKAIDALRYLESRVNRMINVWSLDDIEMVQEEDEVSQAEAPMLQGQADIVDVPADPVSEPDIQSNQPLDQCMTTDLNFAKDDEPVDLEALPRVAPYDVDSEDANSPETDIVCVDAPMPEHLAIEPAAECEPVDIGTDPTTEAAPTAPADPENDAPSTSAAILEDDDDLFASEDVPAAPLAPQVKEDAPATEHAGPHSDDTHPTELPATTVDAPAAEQTGPAGQVETETDSSAARSTAERINRLTPDERIALFS